MEATLVEPKSSTRTRNEQSNEPPPPKLGLEEINEEGLPRLEVLVRNTKSDVIAHVESLLTALIVSPLNRILYLEAACTSDSGAHALMGAVSDPRGSAEFRFFKPEAGDKHLEIFAPQAPSIANVRLQVSNYHRMLNHVAMMDRSGELLLSRDDETLWRKLREKMTCPTLEHWGRDAMPVVHESGLLLECESFGIQAGFTPYVLAPDAQKQFDSIISAHVQRVGGISKPILKSFAAFSQQATNLFYTAD